MKFIQCLIVIACIVAIQAQCPVNVTSIFIISDRTINAPLTVPLCLACRFLNNMGERITFSDGTWTKGMGVGSTALTNGSFDGNVTLSDTSDTTFLTLTYPGAVVSLNDVLVCSSSQASAQNILTIGAFNFLDPTVSPAGTVNVTEGSSLTLTCSDPGNTGTTRYVWMDSAGNALTAIVTSSPLVLELNNIQQGASGVYICRSTKPNDLPDEVRETSVMVNVEAAVVSTTYFSTNEAESSTPYDMPSLLVSSTYLTSSVSTSTISLITSSTVTTSIQTTSSSTAVVTTTIQPTSTVTAGGEIKTLTSVAFCLCAVMVMWLVW